MKNTIKVRRGLQWIIASAEADFETVTSDSDGGLSHFRSAGCTASDIESAFSWLREQATRTAAPQPPAQGEKS